VLDSSELRPLWTGVLRFLSEDLGLCVWPEMSKIPILSVDYGTLNERGRGTGHHGGGPVTRGLCLTETTSGSAASSITVPRLVWTDRGLSVAAGSTFDLGASRSEAYVTAILVLSGLPEALTGSILAHEAIHAWLKLHPGYLSLLQRSGGIMGGEGAFDRQAEEGVCQLVAHLYLSSREGRRAAERTRGEEGDISDEGLRKFFLFSIEKERSEIYGDGFRKAAELYRSLGLEPILQILVETGEFPG